MFSCDKNIETIGQLVEVLRHYVSLQGESVKLNIVDKVVRLLTLTLIYLSFAVAHALSPMVGMAWAFAIVSGCYFFVLLLCLLFRKQWIERPLVRFLASLLMEK